MKIAVNLTKKEVAELDSLAGRENLSRQQVIKQAISNYITAMQGTDWIERGFGYWKDRGDIRDGLNYQLACREDR